MLVNILCRCCSSVLGLDGGMVLLLLVWFSSISLELWCVIVVCVRVVLMWLVLCSVFL